MSVLTTLLQDIHIDGSLRCECPHGQLFIEASGVEERIGLSFSNARTFRYFLDSIPGFGLRQYSRYRKAISNHSNAIQLSIAGKPLLSTTPGSGWSVNYGLGLKQWLLWKMGR